MRASPALFSARPWQGATVIGAVYIFAYAVLVRALAGSGTSGLNWDMGLPMAVALTVVPYLACGFYCRWTGMPKEHVLWTALLAVLVERVFIFGVGCLLYASGGDGTMDGISLMRFIQGEAAPYFTWQYITVGGICSVAITYGLCAKR